MRISPKYFTFKPFSRKQRQILHWWLDESPVHEKNGIIADGAIRSGKSLTMSLSFVLWAMTHFDGENFAMCGKTVGSFRRNVLPTLKPMVFGRGMRLTEYRTDQMFTVEFNGVTNYFYIFGGKDERSQDLIQGITLAGVFLDEVALMPQSFVNQATARCSIPGSKWWFNCNPAGPYHWFKTDWIDKRNEKNLIYLRFRMEDNLALTEEIRERYRSMYTGVFYNRYILGLWVAAEGLIYDMFDRSVHVQHIPDELRTRLTSNPMSLPVVSCDYGTQNATVFELWSSDHDKSYLLREYYYSGRQRQKQKTDEEYADDLAEWLGDTPIRCVVVDPSAASFIAVLKKRGFHVFKAKNDVLDGIRFTASLFLRGQIIIDESCTETLKELQSYVWDAKAADRGDDKPVKENDHCMDAMRYYCMTMLRKNGVRVLK